MSKKVVILIVTVLLFILIPISIFVVMQQQELRKKAAPLTSLSITPSQNSKNVGDEFQVNIVIDTGNNPVILADMYLTYDATKLQFLSAVNSADFPNEQTPIGKPNGSFHYQLTTLSPQTPFVGIGTVATVRFKAIAPTTTPISIVFTEESGVFGIQEGKTNLLIGTTPATVTIGNGGATTPTVSQSVTPTTIVSTPTNTATPSSGILSLTVTSPVNGSTTADTTPLISGRGKPGSLITIVSSPVGINGTTTADTDGDWTFTPTTAVGKGVYTLSITATDPVTGQIQTSNVSFTIGSAQVTTTATITPTLIVASDTTDESQIPVTGTVETTILIASIGIIMLMGGALLPIFVR